MAKSKGNRAVVTRAFDRAKGPVPQAFGRGAQAGQFRTSDAKYGKHTTARGDLASNLRQAHANATSKGGDASVSGKRVRAKAYIAGYKAQTGLAGGGGSARGRQRRDSKGRFA